MRKVYVLFMRFVKISNKVIVIRSFVFRVNDVFVIFVESIIFFFFLGVGVKINFWNKEGKRISK